MTTFVPRYALDPTGINPDNFVANEPHVLADFRVRAVVPIEGAFYSESGLVVVDDATGLPLTPGKQYVPQEYLRTPSELYGKKIYTILLIIDQSVSSNVTISYQAVGHHYNRQSTALKQLLEKKRDDGSDYSFYDVVGRPEIYDPVPHFHSLDDGLKFEYLTTALERIRNAVLWSDSIVYQDIYNYIDMMLKDLEARLQIQMDNFVYPILLDFKAQLNKTWLGLDLIENLRTATREEGAKAAQKDTKFSDFLERKFVALDTIVAFKNILYEHLVSKETTNLGKSQAVFLPATKTTLFEMVNGAVISLLSKRETMTTVGNFDPNTYPDDINEDTRIAITKIVNNRNNGGGIFMAYEYGGKYCYMGTATSGLATSTIQWTKFLFADDLKIYIDDLSAHIQDTNNPHRTNKDQVGLSNVENLPVITREEILCLKSVRKYMTFDAFLLFVKTFMIGKNGSAADPGDESNEPLENCQILYCPCSPCGCGGGTATPEPTNPPAGQLIKQFCKGVDSWGQYTNGVGGNYESIIMTNSIDCGYTPPPTPPIAGTLQSEFCKGKDKWGVYANGSGGTYENMISANSADCGFVVSNPKIVFSSNRTTLSAGVTETMTAVLSGYTPNSTVAYQLWASSPAYQGGTPFKYDEMVQINSGGGATVNTVRTDDGVTVPRGTYDTWAATTGQAAVSNHINRVFTGSVQSNKVITFSVAKSVIRPGDRNTFTWSFSGYPPNTTVFFQVYAQHPQFMGGVDYLTMSDNVQINASGNGVFTLTNASGDDGVLIPRGTVRNWVYDPNNAVKSNIVNVEFLPAANQPSGTKLSEKCVGANLVFVYANGSGGSYEQIVTYNAPQCNTTPTTRELWILPANVFVDWQYSMASQIGSVDSLVPRANRNFYRVTATRNELGGVTVTAINNSINSFFFNTGGGSILSANWRAPGGGYSTTNGYLAPGNGSITFNGGSAISAADWVNPDLVIVLGRSNGGDAGG